MSKKLDAFYTSKLWKRLRLQLMQERAKDGVVICEHCGKPIVRRYDCIAHHRTELTDENVEDYSVSLNPENVELLCFSCHNTTHQRFEGFRQRVYLVYGAPCSGKTSYVDEVANGDDLILDVDRIWDAVCNDGRYNKMAGKSKRPHRLRPNVFGIRDCILDMIRTRKGNWRNAWIIGGFPLRTDRDRLCDLLRAEPIYCEATLDECLARCETERPAEWRDYIMTWFQDFTE